MCSDAGVEKTSGARVLFKNPGREDDALEGSGGRAQPVKGATLRFPWLAPPHAARPAAAPARPFQCEQPPRRALVSIVLHLSPLRQGRLKQATSAFNFALQRRPSALPALPTVVARPTQPIATHRTQTRQPARTPEARATAGALRPQRACATTQHGARASAPLPAAPQCVRTRVAAAAAAAAVAPLLRPFSHRPSSTSSSHPSQTDVQPPCRSIPTTCSS